MCEVLGSPWHRRGEGNPNLSCPNSCVRSRIIFFNGRGKTRTFPCPIIGQLRIVPVKMTCLELASCRFNLLSALMGVHSHAQRKYNEASGKLYDPGNQHCDNHSQESL